MLTATLDAALQFWFLKVPTRNLGTMRLFAISDLVLIVAFRPRDWLLNVKQLAQFQKKLINRQWAGLAQVYPRPYMWVYAYELFFWGRYGKVIGDLLMYPDRSLVAEIFLAYFCQIDRLIDCRDGRWRLRNAVAQIKNNPNIHSIISELIKRLYSLDISTQSKKTIIRQIAEFRRETLKATRDSVEESSGGLNQVIRNKERTVGQMTYVWSHILSKLYDVPVDLSENASLVFFSFAMAWQFIDDISDLVEDYRAGVQNLYLAIAKEEPIEYERLCTQLDASSHNWVNWNWLRKNTRKSYSHAIVLFEIYLERITKISQSNALTTELNHVLDGLGTVLGYKPLR